MPYLRTIPNAHCSTDITSLEIIVVSYPDQISIPAHDDVRPSARAINLDKKFFDTLYQVLLLYLWIRVIFPHDVRSEGGSDVEVLVFYF